MAGTSTAIDDAIFDATRPLVFNAIPGLVDESDNPNFGQAAGRPRLFDNSRIFRAELAETGAYLGLPLTSDRDSPRARAMERAGRQIPRPSADRDRRDRDGPAARGRRANRDRNAWIGDRPSAAAEQEKPLLERIASLAEGCCAPTLRPHA